MANRTFIRISALLAGVLLPPEARAQQAAAESAQPITLGEAVRLAQRNAPEAVRARGEERTSRAAVRSAYGAFLPNVSVSLGGVRQFTSAGARTRINPTTGATETLPLEPWSYSNGLAFNVQLFDGGSRLFDLRSARAGVTAAEASQISQEFNVALETSQQFFNALAARESAEAARAQLEQAQQQLRFSVGRVRAGAATKSDSLRSVIQLGNAQLALLTAQGNLRTANAALTRLVGAPFEVTAAADSAGFDIDAATAPIDTAELMRLAEQGPVVRQAEASLDAAKALRKASKAPYLPTINASYSRGGSGSDNRFGYGNDPFSYSGRLSLSLSYPLFNQFSREEGIVRADVAADNADATLRDARLEARQLLVQYVELLRTASQRVLVQQASVVAAVEDLRVQQLRYNAGASTLLDVLTSQTQLNEAQRALIQARYDARVARARLETLIGRPISTMTAR